MCQLLKRGCKYLSKTLLHTIAALALFTTNVYAVNFEELGFPNANVLLNEKSFFVDIDATIDSFNLGPNTYYLSIRDFEIPEPFEELTATLFTDSEIITMLTIDSSSSTNFLSEIFEITESDEYNLAVYGYTSDAQLGFYEVAFAAVPTPSAWIFLMSGLALFIRFRKTSKI